VVVVEVVIKSILSWIILIGSAITALFVIGKWCRELYRMARAVETMRTEGEKRKLETKILLKCNLTILQGLEQMKCNGPVTEMRKEMQTFLIEN
jgi:hypothetical protein